ncbi:hypothetical protein LY76DRAFT_328768 [Colletotrichum caudatum]|nr:hypothetical protein LY76DRAFT_328768 [Colletotrichum caudatum]
MVRDLRIYVRRSLFKSLQRVGKASGQNTGEQMQATMHLQAGACYIKICAGGLLSRSPVIVCISREAMHPRSCVWYPDVVVVYGSIGKLTRRQRTPSVSLASDSKAGEKTNERYVWYGGIKKKGYDAIYTARRDKKGLSTCQAALPTPFDVHGQLGDQG